MTPLEFMITVKNSDAKNGLHEVQQKVDGFKESVNELYEGPAREMKIRTEIKGIVQDLAMGQSPMTAFLNSMERLSEMGRFAGGVTAVAAVALAVGLQLSKAADEATKFKTRLQDALSTPIEDESLSDLKKDVTDLQGISKDYEKMGWLTKFLYGMQINPAVEAARQLKDMKSDVIALRELTDDTKGAQARSLLASDNPDDQMAGRKLQQSLANEKEVDRVKDTNKTGEKNLADHQAAMAQLEAKYAHDQYAAQHSGRRSGGLLSAAAYGEQKAALEKLIAEDQAVVVQGNADLAAVKKAGEDELTKIQREGSAARTANQAQEQQARLADELELEQAVDKRAVLERRIANDQALKMLGATAEDRDQAGTKEAEDRLALAREISRLETASTEAARKVEELRQQTLHSQFEALDKQDKLVALEAEQTRLQTELSRVGVYSETGKLQMQKELADVQKQLGQMGKISAYGGIDADNALRGNMSSGSFKGVTNEAANRSERHLETMVGYLKTIASKPHHDGPAPF